MDLFKKFFLKSLKTKSQKAKPASEPLGPPPEGLLKNCFLKRLLIKKKDMPRGPAEQKNKKF
jgi:hypothetical protein